VEPENILIYIIYSILELKRNALDLVTLTRKKWPSTSHFTKYTAHTPEILSKLRVTKEE
jgi:hypothetical protein